MKMTSIARKEISREEKDGKETIVNEITRFEFDKVILELLEEIFGYWGYGQDHGICYCRDDNILFIDVDEVIEEMKSRRDSEPEDSDKEKLVIAYLSRFRGYTIWI